MLANKGAKAIDAMLVRKYDLEITTRANTLYNKGKPLIYFYPLVSAAKAGKGVAEYDPEFLGKRPLGKKGKPIKRFIFCGYFRIICMCYKSFYKLFSCF